MRVQPGLDVRSCGAGCLPRSGIGFGNETRRRLVACGLGKGAGSLVPKRRLSVVRCTVDVSRGTASAHWISRLQAIGVFAAWITANLFVVLPLQHHEDLDVVRKVAPLLERAVLSSGEQAEVSSEWKAVPDIWKTAAENYGDRIALVDPHHTPATEVSYKEVGAILHSFTWNSTLRRPQSLVPRLTVKQFSWLRS